MLWSCIECEHIFRDGINGDAEERTCYNCLNEGENENEENR